MEGSWGGGEMSEREEGGAEIGGGGCGSVILLLCTVQQVCVLREQPNNCQLMDWDGVNFGRP